MNNLIFPKIKRVQNEDFFTEILAFILNQEKKLNKSKNPVILKEFLELFGFNDDFANYKIETQVHDKFTGKRTDIEIILDNETSIIIELKIDSIVNEDEETGENQLKNYAIIQNNRLMNRQISKAFVFLLTRDYEFVEQDIKQSVKSLTSNDLRKSYWEDVYKIFHKLSIKIENKVLSFLLKQYCGLMEYDNMEPYNKYTEKELNSFRNNWKNLLRLFEKLKRELASDKVHEEITLGSLKVNKNANDDFIFESFFENEKGKCSPSLVFNPVENNFIFYINEDIETNDILETLKENNYLNVNECGFYPKILFDFNEHDFFEKGRDEQIISLKDFCNKQIQLCKDLNII